MGTPCPALLQKMREIQQQTSKWGREAAAITYIAPLVWLRLLCYTGCMKWATFWRTENKAQRGNTSTLADDKYVIISQTTSSDLYLPTQKESLGFTLQLAKPEGDRGQRVPRGIPSVGRRKSVRSSTSLRSHREESGPCSGGVHSTLPSAGISHVLIPTGTVNCTKVVLQGWAVPSIAPHCLFLLYLQIISECIRCDSKIKEHIPWNCQTMCLSSEKSWCSYKQLSL